MKCVNDHSGRHLGLCQVVLRESRGLRGLHNGQQLSLLETLNGIKVGGWVPHMSEAHVWHTHVCVGV